MQGLFIITKELRFKVGQSIVYTGDVCNRRGLFAITAIEGDGVKFVKTYRLEEIMDPDDEGYLEDIETGKVLSGHKPRTFAGTYDCGIGTVYPGNGQNLFTLEAYMAFVKAQVESEVRLNEICVGK
jgi:hypothetical protein